ncbi:unnamed protein product [Aphanomyces euteiches]
MVNTHDDDMIRLEPSRKISRVSVEYDRPPRQIKHGRLAHLGTQHILRDWAARVIQSRYSHHKKRRRAKQRKVFHATAPKVMDVLIAEYIRCDFIPDILIDILTTKEEEYETVSPHEKMISAFYSCLVTDVTKELLIQIVKGMVQTLVDAYFYDAAAAHHANPWTKLTESFTTEWIQSVIREIVLASVSDLVESYFALQKQATVFDGLVDSLIVETASQSKKDMTIEGCYHVMIQETTTQLLHDMVLEEFTSAKTLREHSIQSQELSLISQASDPLVDHAILQTLLQLMAQRADRIAFKEACDHTLSFVLLKHLLGLQHCAANQEISVASSAVLTSCHNRIMQHNLFAMLTADLSIKLDELEAAIDHDELETP